jgi:hypothetical protein
MSNGAPRYFRLITEHSRCQPGAPLPQGESHSIWRCSPGGDLRQIAKSCGWRLPSTGSIRPSRVIVLRSGELAVIGHGGGVEIQAAIELVAMLGAIFFAKSIISAIWSVATDQRARLADVEVGDVLLERLGVMRGDVPDALGLGARGRLHLVVAGIGVARSDGRHR